MPELGGMFKGQCGGAVGRGLRSALVNLDYPKAGRFRFAVLERT